ncbi:MAG TPA: efflux RND transporter periplasmic adaptor subunit, partial [Steroidobacteraceae bacterium]|nr:efflux RND transporter periplasmic adaptor subunit [Steroidobacteraceae bacterium]
VGATAVVLLVLLCIVPFPFQTSVPGVVWLPDQARIRPETDGFVTKIMMRDGAHVEPGEVLLVLEDPLLLANRDKLASQLDGLRADSAKALLRDPLRARNFEQDIERVEGELRHANEKIAQLELRAQVAGTLAIPRQEDLPGAFAKRGNALGYILDGRDTAVRAAVPEHDAALVRERTRGVEVRLTEAAAERRVAELVREVPAATNQLPSAALSDRGGGPYVVDPADKDGLRTLEPVVLIDLKVPDTALKRAGGRVWVRFDHGAEPLAGQWYRRLRQLFLQHFNPTG